jgi:hypothetical protein
MDIKAQFWTPHVEGWRSSGLGPAAYCRQHGLDLKQFAYWRRTLPVRDVDRDRRALLPIRVSEAPRRDDRVEIRLPNGLQVQLDAGLDRAQLTTLIRALSSC